MQGEFFVYLGIWTNFTWEVGVFLRGGIYFGTVFDMVRAGHTKGSALLTKIAIKPKPKF